MLTPMLIFKGRPNGWIVKHEFLEYPEGCVYACQDNAWMDEQVMLQWVEQILKPLVDTNRNMSKSEGWTLLENTSQQSNKNH